MKTELVLITSEDLLKPIENAISELSIISPDISNIDKPYLIKSVFTYAFVLFESALSETLEVLLTAFPEKLSFKKIDSKEIKSRLIENYSTEYTLAYISEKYIMDTSYKSLDLYLKEFCSLLGIKDVSDNLIDVLIEMKATRNLLVHNNLRVNDKYVQSAGKNSRAMKNGRQNETLTITTDYLVHSVEVITEVLMNYKKMIEEKYREYSKRRLLESLWYSIFNSPLLKFDSFWIIHDDGNISFNEKKARIASLSHSEKAKLSVWFQQFNDTLMSKYLKSNECKVGWHTICDELELIIKVMRKYPGIFQSVR